MIFFFTIQWVKLQYIDDKKYVILNIENIDSLRGNVEFVYLDVSNNGTR